MCWLHLSIATSCKLSLAEYRATNKLRTQTINVPNKFLNQGCHQSFRLPGIDTYLVGSDLNC